MLLTPYPPLHRRWRGGTVKSQRVRTIGTSSLRRKSQLLAKWPQIKIVDLRGNLDTRLRKLQEGRMDAIVVAAAGIKRMFGNSPHLSVGNYKFMPLAQMLPAPGQGAVAVEVRSLDRSTGKMVKVLNHPMTQRTTTAERSLLMALGGGCQVPIGAHARIKGKVLWLEAVVASQDGRDLIRARMKGRVGNPERLGVRLAEKLMTMGAEKILSK